MKVTANELIEMYKKQSEEVKQLKKENAELTVVITNQQRYINDQEDKIKSQIIIIKNYEDKISQGMRKPHEDMQTKVMKKSLTPPSSLRGEELRAWWADTLLTPAEKTRNQNIKQKIYHCIDTVLTKFEHSYMSRTEGITSVSVKQHITLSYFTDIREYAGNCSYSMDDGSIHITIRITIDNWGDVEFDEDTVVHEVAHAIDYRIRRISCHDDYWQKIYECCGGHKKYLESFTP